MADLTPLSRLDVIVGDAIDEITRAHQAGELETCCGYRSELDRVTKAAKQMADAADVAVLDLLPPDRVEGRRTIRGKVEVDGIVYSRAPDEAKRWKVKALIREAIMAAEGDLDLMVEYVASLLPESAYIVVGKPDEYGVRGLGLNPDDFRTSELRGYKLERKAK